MRQEIYALRFTKLNGRHLLFPVQRSHKRFWSLWDGTLGNFVRGEAHSLMVCLPPEAGFSDNLRHYNDHYRLLARIFPLDLSALRKQACRVPLRRIDDEARIDHSSPVVYDASLGPVVAWYFNVCWLIRLYMDQMLYTFWREFGVGLPQYIKPEPWMQEVFTRAVMSLVLSQCFPRNSDSYNLTAKSLLDNLAKKMSQQAPGALHTLAAHEAEWITQVKPARVIAFLRQYEFIG